MKDSDQKRIQELEAENLRLREIITAGLSWAEDARYAANLTQDDINEMTTLSKEPLSPEIQAALSTQRQTLKCSGCGSTKRVSSEEDVEFCGCELGYWVVQE